LRGSERGVLLLLRLGLYIRIFAFWVVLYGGSTVGFIGNDGMMIALLLLHHMKKLLSQT
jgi:hypothetical protein